MTRPVVHGTCLCGSVRFSASLPSKWVAHCHCTYCRRAHGAPFVTWAGFHAGSVTVYEDPDRENHLVFVEEWESEEALRRHFAVPESGAFANALGAMAAVRPRIRLYRATELPFPGKGAA